jgi:hypothetical protein
MDNTFKDDVTIILLLGVSFTLHPSLPMVSGKLRINRMA